MMGEASDIFSLPWQRIRRPALCWLAGRTHRLAERLLGLERLRRIYGRMARVDGESFAQRILEALGVMLRWDAEDVARVPEEGPLAVVANHPFGAAEGLALLELVRLRRPDVKVLANFILGRIPELRDDLILVDPFGAPGSARRNVNALRQALQWLRGGHALIVFPAGEVASLAPGSLRVRDATWHVSVMTLIRHAGERVRVLPVFVPGRASMLFHVMGKLHPRLRTLLLPRELLRLRRRAVTLRVGRPIAAASLWGRFASDAEALRYLRFRTFLLAGRTNGETRFDARMRRLTLDDGTPEPEPVVSPVDPLRVAEELGRLPPEARLLEEGDYVLYAAQGRDIPDTLREIGRLRELTFRAAGEGTGRDLDTDDFDAAYHQIILWRRATREVVGCYRLALSDVLAERDGLRALYTRSLFRFDERFLGHLPGPAVELGRSFVRPGFQRTFAPLLLLWRGVLTFIARHPRYTVLFGPVSISHDFRPAAREMLLEHLRARCFDWALARWVSARLPPRPPRFAEWRHPDYADFLRTESDVNTALLEIEDGRREMPVLIRQYLKLGGRIAAFNVDPDFGTVVDGLIVVDLLKAPPRDIARYMGKTAYEAYVHAPREE